MEKLNEQMNRLSKQLDELDKTVDKYVNLKHKLSRQIKILEKQNKQRQTK